MTQKYTHAKQAALFLAGLALCLAASSAQAAPKEPPSAGKITQGLWQARFSPDRGVALSYAGVPITRRSSLYLVKPGWAGLIYDYRAARPNVAIDGQTLTATNENADVKVGYKVTLGTDNSAVVDFSYALKRDIPCEMEYAAGFVNGSVIADTPYTALTAEGPRSGVVPVVPQVADPENNRFVPSFQTITFGTRLGPLSVAVAGDWPDFVCFDARHLSASWAQEAPIFWIGLGVTPHPLRFENGRTFHVITSYRFSSPPPAPTASAALIASAALAAGCPLTNRADARVPQTVPPVVIPQPKSFHLTQGRLRVNAQTRLVVAEGSTAQDLEAAKAVQRELAVRFGLPALPIVRASAVGKPENLLVFGEPKRLPLAAALLRKAGASPSAKAEGYVIRIGPGWAVIAGHDPAGTFYGAQTLCQLFGFDSHGPFAWMAAVNDYPALPWRGAHLFVGNRALPFHKALIQNVFSRVKLNNLVLQCEQAKWRTAGKSAPAWGMAKEDLRRENTFAQQHFMAVTPLINSVGHMEWLFSDPTRTALAEDPQTPYAVNTANPDADHFLFRLYDEALDVFHPKFLHIGADEVTLRGRYPYQSRAAYPTVAAEWSAQVTKAHDYLARRGVRTMIWGDMLLANGDAPDAANAPTAAQGAQMRAALPKDIVIADWHYGAEGSSSPALLRRAGFGSVIGATWFNPENIAAFSHEQAAGHQAGLLQTTWAGFNSNAGNLTNDPQEFAAFVLAGDYAWTGASTPPDQLPYNPAHVFAAWYAPSRLDPRVRPGFTVDLSPLAGRPLADSAAHGGWLGYGPAHDLHAVPTGTQRFGDVLYALSPRAVLLRGALNPPGADCPGSVKIPLHRAAATLKLLLGTAYAALPQTQVGTLSVKYEDGTEQEMPLVYGRNIAAWDDGHDAPEAPAVWQRPAASGMPTLLRELTWNIHSRKTIASVTLTATDPSAAPVLFALTGLK